LLLKRVNIPIRTRYSQEGKEKDVFKVERNNGYEGYPGFIDFTIGEYKRPKKGIEFMLRYSWSGDEYRFNLEKLNDTRNPFEKKWLFCVLLKRSDTLEHSKLKSIVQETHKNNKNLLQDCCKVMILEIAKQHRRLYCVTQNDITIKFEHPKKESQ